MVKLTTPNYSTGRDGGAQWKNKGVSIFSNFVTLGVLHLPHIVWECILKYCCPNLTLSAIPGMLKLSNPPKIGRKP